jgi:exonuclease III
MRRTAIHRGTERFAYKLAWMERLNRHIRHLLAFEEPLILMGDYNVIPTPDDCHDPNAWQGDALFQPETRAAFRRICHLGPYGCISRLSRGAALLHILGLSSGRMG